ncbi:peptide-methionine (S)-S-oxide reductase [Enterococcus faecium]|uniref:Peptide methionine sulfoxide reductase MsrA n=1 Tax=Enterococcus faecium TaxID=1352 RepID=A0A242AS67_ENTFC|nr:peptide-methionine (S)-S-oxide reductase [Enterococcus faecium]OTN86751.1 peptide-methionine (S)-S-oxide reductase [Enterococcus faecium]
MKTIYLAGGCFWGVEGYFDLIDGVEETRVGYANGQSDVASYMIIDATGHAETVAVTYDPDRITLLDLLQHYFRIINPFSVNRQGNDIGRQYRTGIYYTDEADKIVAEKIMQTIRQKNDGRHLAVELEPLRHFLDAEEYHQDYLKKNPNGYCHIDLGLAKIPLAE